MSDAKYSTNLMVCPNNGYDILDAKTGDYLGSAAHDGVHHEVSRANARLWAAAPELLAACKLALYEVGGGTKTQDFGEACRLRNEAERALRAALARAGQAVPS